MEARAIEAVIRHCKGIPDDARLDVQMIGERAYRCTEVLSDATTGRCFGGCIRPQGGITLVEIPELTIDQARIYDKVMALIVPLIDAAEARGELRFPLFKFGTMPELFDVDRRSESLYGNLHPEMLNVWHCVANSLEERGYTDSMLSTPGGTGCADWCVVAWDRADAYR